MPSPPPTPGRPVDHRGQRTRHPRQARRPGRDRFAQAAENLDAVDALVADWRQAVHDGRAQDEGYGTWLNIPSKVAQVAAVRAAARKRRTADLAENKLLMALCPGLIDTDASRPWFDDMSQAQTPAQAASWPVKLALAPTFDPAFYGELVQFGKVLPWSQASPSPTPRPPDPDPTATSPAASRTPSRPIRTTRSTRHARAAQCPFLTNDQSRRRLIRVRPGLLLPRDRPP